MNALSSSMLRQQLLSQKQLWYGGGTQGVAGPEQGARGPEGRGRGTGVSVKTPNAHPRPRSLTAAESAQLQQRAHREQAALLRSPHFSRARSMLGACLIAAHVGSAGLPCGCPNGCFGSWCLAPMGTVHCDFKLLNTRGGSDHPTDCVLNDYDA
jgi:hypothetical protein